MKNLIIAALVAVVAIGASVSVFAVSDPVVEVRVWQSVTDESLLYVSTKPAGGSWTTHNTALDMSEISASGRFRQSNFITVDADGGVTVQDDDLPPRFRYDSFDATGAVTAAGSYAFLAPAAGAGAATDAAPDAAPVVVTTYEALREEADTLRVHRTDADGAARAAFYGTVAVGDRVEWHRAADCFTRYVVTRAPTPAADASYREFGVTPETYAFTGCSGALAPPGAASGTITVLAADLDFGVLPPLGGPSLTAPIIHGPFQLVPAG